MVIVSLGMTDTPVLTIAVGAVLVLACAFYKWRGLALKRAVAPGLASGTLAAIIPMIGRACGEGCSPLLGGFCSVSCILAGIAAGATVAYFARKQDRDRATFLFAAGTIAMLAGSLGCALAGFGGIIAMTAGAIASAAPVVLAPGLRSP
jgi:hypothetical protein